ncbi:MAG: Lrp/AsnC family transcriptional regulator [Eubacteriales bacterium]|nr:Lrp/AsnC family transcriptional regulator [Eubacteriales bacterium]
MYEEKILRLIENDARLAPETIAVMLGAEAEAIKAEIKAMEDKGTIVRYRTLINWDKSERDFITAIIELKVIPQRGEGFEKIAERIYQYPEVKDVYLVSGGYDLGVVIEGDDMKGVALFVAEKLATMEHVVSTATHFILKKYKADGIILEDKCKDERRMITL